jgi:hypothetical protein
MVYRKADNAKTATTPEDGPMQALQSEGAG